MPSTLIHPPFDAYEGKEPYVFVSYSHKDAALVFPDLVRLREEGVRIWYDEGIDPGNEWPEEVATALKGASLFLVYITANAVASQNVRNEINLAINKKKTFVAVHLEETELPSGLELRMGDIQAILKYRMTEESYWRKLFKVLPDSLNDLQKIAKPARTKIPPAALPAPPPAPVTTSRKPEPELYGKFGEENSASSKSKPTKVGKLLFLALAGVALIIVLLIEFSPSPPALSPIAPTGGGSAQSPPPETPGAGVAAPAPATVANAPPDPATTLSTFFSQFESVTGIKLVHIPAGTFTMGSPADEVRRDGDEGPQTLVTLTHDFYLGATEVTQAQWRAVMGNNSSHFNGDTLPVETVSWEDAMAFCQKLTERERTIGLLPKGYAFTLPTEAQWEYACRAGSGTNYFFGDDVSRVSEYAWIAFNSGNKTHPVATKRPNAWGLFDMQGNVCEWCADWFWRYPGGSVTDPTGPILTVAETYEPYTIQVPKRDEKGYPVITSVPKANEKGQPIKDAAGNSVMEDQPVLVDKRIETLTYRVVRGCCWYDLAEDCGSAFRDAHVPVYRNHSVGFRLALSAVR